jgi:hypothetical protein
MAQRARMSLTVTSSRTAAAVRVSTIGSYKGLPVNTVDAVLTDQPLFSNADAKTFWLGVLAVVQAYVSSLS